MIPNLSQKQRDFYFNSVAPINIAHGAVRAGKTWAALWRFIVHCVNGPKGDMMILGRTRDTVEINVISELHKMIGPKRARWNRGTGHLYIGDRLVHVRGVNDAQAESKIRGSTLAGAYCNEMTILQHRAFDQLIDRNSLPGAAIFGDTNPDSPHHWLNTEFLQNDEMREHGDLLDWRFVIDDNPYLPREYIERIKRSHSGVWYKRMVEGLWVAAQGAIYDQYDESIHVVEKMPGTPEKVIIGCDYGTQNATVFLALGKVGQTYYVFDEYYHSGRESHRQKTDAEYSAEFIAFLDRIDYVPQSIEIDPSAASFKAQLRKDGVHRLRDADNAVVDGIRNVSTGLTTGRLKILRKCEELRSEIPGYVWDEKKAEAQGKEEPMKGEGIRDHALDALRYACARALGRADLRVVRKVGA